MNISAPFIFRPVATTLLTLAIALAGMLGFSLLPVAPLPQVDFPAISVSASLPGASPETMASSVATPLERSLGRIAGVSEMTSMSSSLGSSTRVMLQFDLSRDIDGAARDVQAAINAARSLLPSGMPSNPTYRKVNPSDAPIMILTLTSGTLTRGQMYDLASTVLAQTLAQVEGVGQVSVGGSSLPAVRVELNPDKLAANGISLDQVRTAITNTNANRPKGAVEQGGQHWQVDANDQVRKAAEYEPLVLSYRNGAAVRLGDVAKVSDSVQDVRNAGMSNAQPAILLIIQQPAGRQHHRGTVAHVRELLPRLQASIPPAIELKVISDRSPTIRASLEEVEQSLVIAVALVILVVFPVPAHRPRHADPRGGGAGVADRHLRRHVPVRLQPQQPVADGADHRHRLRGGRRHRGAGEHLPPHRSRADAPMQAALRGAREVGFTVLSMSLSLVAVFIPLLLMGGLAGRLFREFAVTLSASILVSLVVSLTLTPMMCASRVLQARKEPEPGSARRKGWFARAAGRFNRGLARGYRRSLMWTLRHQPVALLSLVAVIALNVHLYGIIPKTFFPQQDTGVLIGGVQADQSISFQAMREKLLDRFMEIILSTIRRWITSPASPAAGSATAANFYITLKPLKERKVSADQVVNRLRDKLAQEPGANLFLMAVQDIRVGGRQANAQLPVHAAGGRPGAPCANGSRNAQGAGRAAGAGGRQLRPAGQGRADLAGDRPRRRGAPGHLGEHHRHDAEQRLRPAPGRRPSTTR